MQAECPKEWRERIFIDDGPTSEFDYSGLHIVMLYAREGIDYWTQVGTDPYLFELPDFDGTAEHLRAIVKQLLLVALNARDEKATFAAFRNEAEAGSPEKGMGNGILSNILSTLKERHQPIAHMIANDAGIDLMNQDSIIAERIINHFTRRGIPTLAIHDSFIVPFGLEKELDDTMQEAFVSVMQVARIKVKEVTSRPLRILQHSQQPKTPFPKASDNGLVYLGHRITGPDVSGFFAAIKSKYQERHNPKRTARYQSSLRRFRAWLLEQQKVRATG